MVQGSVYKAKDPNAQPNPFVLTAPADGSEQRTNLVLDWTDNTDPDGDSITYTILLSEGDDNFADPIRIENLVNSFYIVKESDGLRDLSTYYWKVRAIDPYGAFSETTVWLFNTNNDNPDYAPFEGHVRREFSLAPIFQARVADGTREFFTDALGKFGGRINPGTHTFTVSANGYVTKEFTAIVFPNSFTYLQDYLLRPDVTIGDINDDDTIDLIDAIIGLKVLAGENTTGLVRENYASSGTDVNQNGIIDMGRGSNIQTLEEKERFETCLVSLSLKTVRFTLRGDRICFNVPMVVIPAVGVGIIGGIYGIGRGAIIAPFLVTLLNIPVYAAAGAVLAANFLTSLVGLVFYTTIPLNQGITFPPDWILGILFGIGGLTGMYCGAKWQRRAKEKTIKAVLCMVVFTVSVRYITQYF